MTEQRHVNQIGEGKMFIVDAYRKSLDTYFSVIKERYNNTSISDKEKILTGLESMALGREIPFKPIEPFNGKRAKKIRKNLDITQNSLAKKLGISLSLIVKYEKEERIPSYPMSEKSKKYLYWLVENGYNPYNIDFSH